MRLWIPGEPGGLDPDAARERACAGGVRVPRVEYGLAVRFRFVYKLPAGPLEVRPDLPADPPLLELAQVWAVAVESILWVDGAQLGQVYARREWGNVAGVEVSL